MNGKHEVPTTESQVCATERRIKDLERIVEIAERRCDFNARLANEFRALIRSALRQEHSMENRASDSLERAEEIGKLRVENQRLDQLLREDEATMAALREELDQAHLFEKHWKDENAKLEIRLKSALDENARLTSDPLREESQLGGSAEAPEMEEENDVPF